MAASGACPGSQRTPSRVASETSQWVASAPLKSAPVRSERTNRVPHRSTIRCATFHTDSSRRSPPQCPLGDQDHRHTDRQPRNDAECDGESEQGDQDDQPDSKRHTDAGIAETRIRQIGPREISAPQIGPFEVRSLQRLGGRRLRRRSSFRWSWVIMHVPGLGIRKWRRRVSSRLSGRWNRRGRPRRVQRRCTRWGVHRAARLAACCDLLPQCTVLVRPTGRAGSNVENHGALEHTSPFCRRKETFLPDDRFRRYGALPPDW